MPRKAYKVMHIYEDGTYGCRNMKYEIGKTYQHEGKLELCGSGFHCCANPLEVMEIEIPDHAEVLEGEDKWCVNEFTVIGPVTDKSFNTGYGNTRDWNTGYGNTGDWNTGDRNTGDRNTGDRNTGHWNTGDWNTGHWNNGDRNTGDWNTGHCNTGDRNTGDRNTGDWNTADYQTGFFNTKEQPVSLFNGRASMPRNEFLQHPGYYALTSVNIELTRWVDNKDLPEKERSGEETKGKTVAIDWFEAHKIWWSKMTCENKTLIQTIPGFCPEIFKEITGIEV